MIPALVLTAGLATRLRPLSLVRAKAALPVAGEPLVRRILRGLRRGGVTDAVLNLHHLPHTLTGLVGDGEDLDLRVRYSWENPVLGSAGGPRRALPLLEGGTFLIVNGDTLTTVDVPALIAEHRRTQALVTMAVIPNREPAKYGGILADRDGSVTGLVPRGSPAASYHFVGIQVAEAAAFTAVPENVPYESLSALYPSLMASRPGAVRVFVCDADFVDIGTPADYWQTCRLLGEREGVGFPYGTGTHVHGTARLERTVLWDGVVVGEGTLLRECVVTDGVHVPDDTSWIGVILRRAGDTLAPGERRVGDLAISALDGIRD
jgi:NDP-sugar pyrophosphorylase family protein